MRTTSKTYRTNSMAYELLRDIVDAFSYRDYRMMMRKVKKAYEFMRETGQM